MAFQDFDQISERRKLERQQKMRKRIMIAVVLLLLILVAVAAAVVYLVVFKNKNEDASANKSNKSAQSPPPKEDASATASPSPPKDKPTTSQDAAAPPPDDSAAAASSPPPEGAAAASPPAPPPEGDNASAAPTTAPAPAPDAGAAAAAPSPQGEGAIGALCGATDFTQTCGDILSQVLKTNSSGAQPNDLLKATMSAAIDEMQTGIDALNKINKDTPEKTVAQEDCVALLGDAKRDLNSSIYILDSNSNNDAATTTAELNNKLSAALTYQDMCVDGFPESERSTAQSALKKAGEHTINSLAVTSQLWSSTSSPPPKRRLLTTPDSGFPTWINQGVRRLLEEDEGGANSDPHAFANITVAKDGSGNHTAINDAIKAIPPNFEGRYFIYIKEGVYEENVIVAQANLTFFGDGSQKSIISASKNIVDDLSLYQSATVVIAGHGFFAYKIGFRNTAGPEKLQAVALRVQSDESVFMNCRMVGYQSVIYAQTYRQFYRGCYITGTADIISGNAAAVFQNCQIYLRKPLDSQSNTITAQARSSKRQTTGTILQSCGIFADEKLEPEKSKIKSYLGRPMKEYSRTIVMETDITDVIDPQGWEAGPNGENALSNVYYGEYNNKGAGSETGSRVKWPGYQAALNKDAALNYTVETFLQGHAWLKDLDVQVRFSLTT